MKGELTLDRRKLLKLGFSAGFLATLPVNPMVFADDVTDALLRFVSDSESPVDSAEVGILSQQEFDSLFSLCEFIDESWKFGTNLAVYREQLRTDLELKTNLEPSYLAEYRSALELLELANADWPSLLFSETDTEEFSWTRLGRARQFVFSEIIRHQVPISGAFKSFGLVNYRGYFGGPYASSASFRRADF